MTTEATIKRTPDEDGYRLALEVQEFLQAARVCVAAEPALEEPGSPPVDFLLEKALETLYALEKRLSP